MVGGKVKRIRESHIKLHLLTGDRPFTARSLIGDLVNAVYNRVSRAKARAQNAANKTQTAAEREFRVSNALSDGELTRVGTIPDGGFVESSGKTR